MGPVPPNSPRRFPTLSTVVGRGAPDEAARVDDEIVSSGRGWALLAGVILVAGSGVLLWRARTHRPTPAAPAQVGSPLGAGAPAALETVTVTRPIILESSRTIAMAGIAFPQRPPPASSSSETPILTSSASPFSTGPKPVGGDLGRPAPPRSGLSGEQALRRLLAYFDSSHRYPVSLDCLAISETGLHAGSYSFDVGVKNCLEDTSGLDLPARWRVDETTGAVSPDQS